MAAQVFSNGKLYVDGYDWSGDINAIAFKVMAEMKENTPWNAVTRTRLAGLKDFSFQCDGYWNGGTGNVDDAAFSKMAANNTVFSIAGSNAAGVEGEVAYSGQLELAQYTPGAKVGDVFAFQVSGQAGAGPLVRGTVLVNGTKTVTGNGTIFQLGAVAAGQKLYAAAHVIGVPAGSSPTLDLKVQSAALVGFGSPTDRITFSQFTARGAQWGTPVAGAITDQFYRVVYTIGGTGSPSFPVVVVVGIL